MAAKDVEGGMEASISIFNWILLVAVGKAKGRASYFRDAPGVWRAGWWREVYEFRFRY